MRRRTRGALAAVTALIGGVGLWLGLQLADGGANGSAATSSAATSSAAVLQDEATRVMFGRYAYSMSAESAGDGEDGRREHGSGDPEHGDHMHPARTETEAVRAMLAHHIDAIEGTDRYLAEHAAEHPLVDAFAQRLRRVQSAEAAQMQSWLSTHGEDPTGTGWAPMFAGTISERPDVWYLSTMIPHHQAAVAMYEEFLGQGMISDLEMGMLIRRIALAQTGEIEWMRQELARQ